jgi:hypothetical protein
MNDTMSLLLATGILAVGGLGLFMYKTSSDDKIVNEDDNNDSMFDFDLRSYFGNSNDNEDEKEYDEHNEDNESDFYEPPKRSRGSKTKSTRKISGTKRRY